MSLSYISSSRKKSCKGCVKAKRRCDLGYPYCKRCFQKGLTCTYSNPVVREAEEVVVRLRTPDLVPLAKPVVGAPKLHRDATSIDPALLHASSDSSSSPESIPDNAFDEPPRWLVEAPVLREGMLPQLWEPAILSEAQVSECVRRLSNFIPSLVYSGSTPFIHETLYLNWQPGAYQDCLGVSALYLAKTRKNIPIIRRSIESKISSLIAASKTWSLREHLTAVQALILYQIIRLFDPDLGLQAQAEKHNKLLEVWTAHLWKRFFNEKPRFNSGYDSWVFEETMRRTVLMSVYMRGISSCLKNGGWCDQVPVLSKLPIASNARLWEGDAEWVMSDTWSSPEEKSKVITYKDFSWSWTVDDDLDPLTEWQKLLLVACRGGDDPRLLSC